MSLDALAWAWRNSRARGTDLLVLLAIADYANDETGLAWPSRSALARKARVATRTVERHVAHLVSIGELEVTHRQRDNGSQSSNGYALPGLPRHPDARGGRQIDEGGSSDCRPTTTRGKTRGGRQIDEGGSSTVTTPEPSLDKKPRARRSRQTAWPASLTLDAAMRATAKDAGVGDAAWQSREFRKFHAHAEAQDRRCASWRGAWRQWCLHAVEYAERDGRGSTSTPPANMRG